tara:strand:+ start:503 stop:619 length:117 start_codon:yes stop_codon:yes gene_type:complete
LENGTAAAEDLASLLGEDPTVETCLVLVNLDCNMNFER